MGVRTLQTIIHKPGPFPRWLLWGAGFVALGAPAFVPGRAEVAVAADELEDYKLAIGLYNRGRWQLAADSFSTFLKKTPRHVKAESAKFYLGLTYINLEDYVRAREVLRAYLKEYPQGRDRTEATYWAGQCSFLLDDYPVAEAELTEFVNKAPEHPLLERALPYLGEVELKLGKAAQAETHFSRALQLYPKGALAEDARFGLAKSYELQKRSPDAVRLYRELAQDTQAPRAAEAQLNLGSRYFDDGDYASASSAFDDLIKRFPKSDLLPLAVLDRGFAQYRLEKFGDALQSFRLAAETPKHAAEAALWQGMCHKSMGELAEAERVLEQASTTFSNDRVADQLLYQWADTVQRRGQFDRARELYVQLVRRWPQGSLADAALHGACLAAMNAGRLAETDELLARFDKEYPGNKLRLRQDVIRARLALARNDPAAAVQRLRGVLSSTDIESTRLQAGYYLAAAEQRLGRHAEVLAVTQPWLASLEKLQPPEAREEFLGGYVVRGSSALTLAVEAAKDKTRANDRQRYCAIAAEAAEHYLNQAPRGALADQALSLKVLAEAHAGNKAKAEADLASFEKSFPQSPELDRTVFELGQIALANDDLEWSTRLFQYLADRPPDSKYHTQALLDLGWSFFKRKRFDEAAGTFARVLDDHPSDPLAPEAGFMRGRSLLDGGHAPEAAQAFLHAFQKFGDSDQAYLAGLQAARVFAHNRDPDQADKVYEQVAQRFSRRADHDQLLHEWAQVELEANRTARADEIFRRLVRERPQSPLADNAQFSLAESELLAGHLDAARAQFAALANSPQADSEIQQQSLYQLMRIQWEAHNWEAVRETCRASRAKFPKGTYADELDFHHAEADVHLQDFAAAQDKLARLKGLKQQPEFRAAAWYPRVWVLLAETHLRRKQHADVLAVVTEFREWDPRSPFLYQAEEILGRSLKAQARFPEARAAFERVIEDSSGRLTETAAKSQFETAETYVLEKNYKAALVEYLKVEIRYNYPEWQAPALYQAGACHESLQEWKDALKTYENLLRDYPQSEFAAKARERIEFVKRKATG